MLPLFQEALPYNLRQCIRPTVRHRKVLNVAFEYYTKYAWGALPHRVMPRFAMITALDTGLPREVTEVP